MHSVELLEKIVGVKTSLTPIDGLIPVNAAVDDIISKNRSFDYLLGHSDTDKALVHQWINYSQLTIQKTLEENDQGAQKNVAKFLNASINSLTYFVSNHITIADLAVYLSIHSYILKLSKKRQEEFNSLVRWFDLIQNSDFGKLSKLEMITFDLDLPLESEVNDENTKKDSKKDAKNIEIGAKKQDEKSKTEGAKQTEKKVKKEKVKAAPVEEKEQPANIPSRLDIRVGLITACKNHENAESLYVEQIDVGESEPRTIVSGLVKHIPLDQMLNRKVLVLCNLKPATMRGVKSAGMVLAATSAEGKVELLEPHKDSKPGQKAFFDGFNDGNPDPVLNPKKKVWETIQPSLFTDDNRVASYTFDDGTVKKVCPLKTTEGFVTVQSVVKATIK